MIFGFVSQRAPGWWAAFKAWWTRTSAQLQARWFVWRDREPSFWTAPARDDVHAGYRRDYELLIQTPKHTDGQLLQLAAIIRGLQSFGDNPLARPSRAPGPQDGALWSPSPGPQPAVRGFVGLPVALGAGSIVQLLPLLGVAAAVLWLVFTLNQVSSLREQRDAACSARELGGRTTRAPCLALKEVAAENARLAETLDALRRAQSEAIADAVNRANETRELNRRVAERRRAAEERRRRAVNDDAEALRDARAPDWDSRLRELSGASGDGAGAPDASGSGGPGGVPAGGAGDSGAANTGAPAPAP